MSPSITEPPAVVPAAVPTVVPTVLLTGAAPTAVAELPMDPAPGRDPATVPGGPDGAPPRRAARRTAS